MEPMARVELLLSGIVQGVFFRGFTREVAHSLGLKGWVRNLSDGRVEALLEGQRAVIEKALKKLRVGPPGAFVDNIEIKWESYIGDQKEFHILYRS
jgi:acylphosphatase